MQIEPFVHKNRSNVNPRRRLVEFSRFANEMFLYQLAIKSGVTRDIRTSCQDCWQIHFIFRQNASSASCLKAVLTAASLVVWYRTGSQKLTGVSKRGERCCDIVSNIRWVHQYVEKGAWVAQNRRVLHVGDWSIMFAHQTD